MAEVIGIISGLYTAGQALKTLAHATHKWRRLSDRLYDIEENLEIAELTLESWRHKYDIQERRPIIYMQVLFGKQGCERIQATLANIKIIARTIKSDINKAIGNALKVRNIRAPPDNLNSTFDEELIKDCLRRIRQNTSWSRKFELSLFGKANDMELRIDRLNRKLSTLECFTDRYLEKEHPDLFSEIKRLPGRRVILKVGDGRVNTIQKRLQDALASRKDANLLHHASDEGNRVHIGLSVPQVLKRDFAFLMNVNGSTHEVLAHPVKIKNFNNPTRVQRTFQTAVPALISNSHEKCYMLPASSASDGFQISLPPTNLLSDLEYKDSLLTIIRDQNTSLGSQVLYPRDQSALATGIAQGSFQLIGSEWLNSLDCNNVRWRRTKEGKWISMLTANKGPNPTTRSLQQCWTANKDRADRRDLSKHVHIFRIGLVLAEIALKTPISYVSYDSATNTMKLYRGDGEEVDAAEVAAEVEAKGNVFLRNMVFFCLSVLQDRDMMADKSIEGAYFKEVLGDAEKLDGQLQAARPKV